MQLLTEHLQFEIGAAALSELHTLRPDALVDLSRYHLLAKEIRIRTVSSNDR